MFRSLTLALMGFTLALSLLPGSAAGQQVDCTVNVNYEAVSTTHKDQLGRFADDVRNYVSNYNWGGGDAQEKVKCTLNIFVTATTGDNQYTAQVFIGSQRPIYNSEQSTAVMRLFDDNWEFTYVKDRPLDHNLFQFSDLASFIDFYMLLIMGYDYDTYEPMGGTALFQQAANLASLAGTSGQRGWSTIPGSYKRTLLLRELLSAQFRPVRLSSYRYHFAGLDSLATNQARAHQNILEALEAIGATRKNVDPQNLLIQSFFETKYLEIASLFLNYPDPAVYARLAQIDPQHRTAYADHAKKRGG